MRDAGDFAMDQTIDPDGSVRLALVGELDYVQSEGLLARLEQLKAAGTPVRLDLSRLEFIDSAGVRAIIVNVRDAPAQSWRLEVDRTLSRQVKHVFDVLGLGTLLWPEAEPEHRSSSCRRDRRGRGRLP